jgi:hypothetical protein
MFFFEKKNQKTFASWCSRRGIGQGQTSGGRRKSKSFLVLFFQKRTYLLLGLHCPESPPLPLHLIKLSVGSQSLDDLRDWQARHGAAHPPLRHRTRNFPRRAEEILDGGSIYWVINRVVTARQGILDILEAVREDGSGCADLVLDPVLVPVRGRFMKPFQGWRYLAAKDAPADEMGGAVFSAELPEALRRDLLALALL